MNLAKNELRISITAACNMKCVYCHNEGNTKMAMLTKEQIREIVEASKDFELKNTRNRTANLFMGEQVCR